ncbi:MAG: sigma-54-dependent transcriptional regulator [Candidatus Eiseniibacteriota bacterium]
MDSPTPPPPASASASPQSLSGGTPTRPSSPDHPRCRVLVVDDYRTTADSLVEQLESWGHEARATYTGEQALELLETFQPEIIVSDLKLPGISGVDVLSTVHERTLDVEFILLTGQDMIETDTAIKATKMGAYDFLTKPIDSQHLRLLLDRAAERRESRRQMSLLRRDLANTGRFGRMLGKSEAMMELYQVLEQVAPSSASVLITGESGTGKELVARTIHQCSPRAAQPFMAINCAAIHENLLESELFGHEKGSFTGAVATRQGCFELADGGTVFLDEIGEMSPSLQAKLLRVLEERAFRRVGGRNEIQIDVRVLAATNRDVDEARKTGALREDLYYRLNVLHLHLPPLRERGDDKLLLATQFIREFTQRESKEMVELDPAGEVAIMAYGWPGNVRELRNAMERAVIVARGPRIGVEDLPPDVRGKAGMEGPVVIPGMSVDDVERQLIFVTLKKTGWNKTRSASLLKISLKTLHNKLRRYREEGLWNGQPEHDPATEAGTRGNGSSERASGDRSSGGFAAGGADAAGSASETGAEA